MMNGKQYIESLKELHPEVYYLGERISCVTEHPAFIPHINAAALTYDLARTPNYEDIMTTKSHLTGETINFFTHIHHSRDDLLKKVKALRTIGQFTGSCFQRCVGHDGLNSVYSTTYDMDRKTGSDYHQRFIAFLKKVQAQDMMISGAMTDAKGDRSLAPGKQNEAGVYVRVIEKTSEGIVVNGAKAQITGAVNSHGHLIMPTASMQEDDADYALSFYVPVDTPGVIHIFGRQTNDTRKCDCVIDQGNKEYGIVGGEALVIFDNVFIPWENVFMCGEYQFAYDMVERFATAHRQNYGGCKVGLADVLIGASYALSEIQGVLRAGHVRDKLIEMVHLAETLYCCSLACSCEGIALPAGSYMADPLLANVTKLNVTRNVYEIARLAQDIAGGILATAPSEFDLKSGEVGEYVKRYMGGVADSTTENRLRLIRLLESMTCGTALVESMHGAGSPQAQRIMIQRQADFENKKRLAYRLCGLTTNRTQE